MREQVLTTSLWLPRTPEEIFPFFADAANLDAITPPWLHFRIRTPLPIQMKAGALIEYSLRLHLIPIRWKTHIASWNPPHSFVDEQISGPYQKWHHTHTFEREGDGTRCIDCVRYRHIGGMIAERLLVRPDIERIFEYRKQTLLARFGQPKPDPISAAPRHAAASR